MFEDWYIIGVTDNIIVSNTVNNKNKISPFLILISYPKELGTLNRNFINDE